VVAIVLFGVAGSAPTSAQSPLRLGTEFQVNTYTPDDQSQVAVGRAGNGSFVVVWQSGAQDGSDFGIFAARFDSLGARVASEFQVNSITAQRQSDAAVDVDADGDFVVAWMSDNGVGTLTDVLVRRFTSLGAAQGPEFQVNIYTPTLQRYPAVALDSDGDFVVSWESVGQDGANVGVFARRFDSAGVSKATEFQVTTHTLDYQSSPVVALDSDGDFVIAWGSGQQDGSGSGVFTRRFTSSGVGSVEVLANVRTSGNQSGPALSIDQDGDFVVTWMDSDGGGSFGVFGRRFNAVGAPVGGEFQVNMITYGVQEDGFAAMDADGDFVVAWSSRDPNSSSAYDIFVRRFDSAGVAGPELQVNIYTLAYQVHPEVATASGEQFVVVWDSDNQDGSQVGVFAQRFANLAVLDIDGNGTFGPLTDALLILRFAFGFTGATLTGGAVGQGCTRCDAPSIQAYLETLV
jgi:hypothetical protein